MATIKIILKTAVAGKDESGTGFSWSTGDEVDCEKGFATRLITKGYAEAIAAKVQAKPKTARKKSVKVQ